MGSLDALRVLKLDCGPKKLRTPVQRWILMGEVGGGEGEERELSRPEMVNLG